MAFQTVFRRVELKYMITPEQKERVIEAMREHMEPDAYGRSVIRNIYFDTDSYRLIRGSIEKPAYKEKLRVRSYKRIDDGDRIFVELKKKYKHVVYKRRLSLPERDAMEWLCGRRPQLDDTQISREVDYFLEFYGGLAPKAFLSYEREAYYSKEDSGFRVTFDGNVLCRFDDLSLKSEVYGERILPEGCVLMEIKCSGGMPLWMAHLLSSERIYKTSFSKYGTAYREHIFPRLKNRDEIDKKGESYA